MVCQTATSTAVEHHSGNSGHCFALFLHVVHCCFLLSGLLHPSLYWTCLFFNTFQHQAYVPSSQVSLLLVVYPFLNLHHIHYQSFLDIKGHKSSVHIQMTKTCCFMIINTYCVYMKMQTYPKSLYGLIYHSLYGSLTLSYPIINS